MAERTFQELTQQYLADYFRGDQKTMRLRLRVVGRRFGESKLSEITPPAIEDFISERLSAGISKSTTNRYRAALSSLYNWAIDRDLYPGPNPVRKVRKFPESAGRARFMTQAEAARLIEVAPPHLKTFLTLAFHTGGRCKEILSLTWGDIDLDARIVVFRGETTKSKKQRIVPMHPDLRAFLLEQRRGLPEHLVCHWNGQPLHTVRTAFEAARKRAGLGRDVVVHTCRHSFASWAVQAGMPIYTLQKLLGHSSVTVTERYSHLDPGYMAGTLRYMTGPRTDEGRA